ncbi:MAG: glycosyltransferase [bacterium]|nr:glycosyltransferase [bacterium]
MHIDVSVIIPTYNRIEYIADAIKSVINQTYRNYEILVVDDGSTDETRKVVNAFESKRIRYFYRDHQGISSSLNFGINHSRGRFVARLDSDDIHTIAVLEKHHELISPGEGHRWLSPYYYMLGREYFLILIISDEDRIRYFDITDSPLFISNALENPQGNLRLPCLENLFGKVLERFQPDLVHIHELHRLPASIIDIVRDRNLPVAVSVHDYWFICSLFQLFTPQETICPGPRGGRNYVVSCLAGDRLTRLYRRLPRILAQTLLDKVLRNLRNTYKRFKTEPPWQTARGIVIKTNPHNLSFKRLISDLDIREMRLRRLLASSDLIHAVSTEATKVFIAHGVPESRVRVMNLGVKAVDWLTPQKKTVASLPLKVGFLGHLGPVKGAQVLIDANRLVKSGGIEIHLFGKGRPEDLQSIRSSADKKNNIVYHGPYDYKNLQAIFDQIHTLVIPSLWNETLGLIGLEAQAAGVPVIASAIGGMLDYVDDGVNGYLFNPGNSKQLADILTGFVSHPERIEALSGKVKSPQNMTLHAENMLQLYRGIQKHA